KAKMPRIVGQGIGVNLDCVKAPVEVVVPTPRRMGEVEPVLLGRLEVVRPEEHSLVPVDGWRGHGMARPSRWRRLLADDTICRPYSPLQHTRGRRDFPLFFYRSRNRRRNPRQARTGSTPKTAMGTKSWHTQADNDNRLAISRSPAACR